MRWGHVRVHENADRLAGAHGGEQSTDEVVLADRLVSVHGAVALDKRVDEGIVQWAHHDGQWMPVQRVREGGKLPRSQMAGKKQHSLAAGERVLVIFEAVVDDYLGDIFQRITWEKANLRELASKGNVLSAKNAAAFVRGHFRKSDREVTHPDFAEPAMEAKDGEPYSDAGGARDGAGKQAHEFDRGPDHRIFESFAHLPECRGSRGLYARKSRQKRAGSCSFHSQ